MSKKVVPIMPLPESWRKLHERSIKPSEKKAMAKKKYEKQAITEADAPSYDRFGGQADPLVGISAEYLSINAQITELENRKKELRGQVEEILINLGEPAIRGDFWLVEVVTSHTVRRLSDTKLLEHGVHMDVIDQCWQGGDEYHYIKISPQGE